MKLEIISFSLLFMAIVIGCIELSSTNAVNKNRKESYHSCIRLREKAPYFNLKCEILLDDIKDNREKSNGNIDTNIKSLSLDKSATRKVDKNQEIKLKNLIRKLSHGKKLRID